MKCRILAGYHEFGRTLKEVIPEKPQICLKSPRVTISSQSSTKYEKFTAMCVAT